MSKRHIIKLRADGHVLTGMEIHETHDGERDKQGTLVSNGGVEFITPRGKRLFLQYTEFSFIINPSTATLRAAA